MESGAPGEAPDGNCETKCVNWFKACNQDPTVDAISVLGLVIQGYMDTEPPKSLFGDDNRDSLLKEGQERIISALERNNLTYKHNGYVIKSGSTVATKTLEDHLKKGDFKSVEREFERAISNLNTDPHTSITAASAIIESVLKYYIERKKLAMPRKMNIGILWQTVRQDLTLNPDSQLSDDQIKILTGVTSIIDGVGAFRSHIGSAHGRGESPPKITTIDARLGVNVAHCIVTYIMDVLTSS